MTSVSDKAREAAAEEREKIVAWLNAEAQDCHDRMAAAPDHDMAPLYGQRFLYYRQAAGLISKGVHATAIRQLKGSGDV